MLTPGREIPRLSGAGRFLWPLLPPLPLAMRWLPTVACCCWSCCCCCCRLLWTVLIVLPLLPPASGISFKFKVLGRDRLQGWDQLLLLSVGEICWNLVCVNGFTGVTSNKSGGNLMSILGGVRLWPRRPWWVRDEWDPWDVEDGARAASCVLEMLHMLWWWGLPGPVPLWSRASLLCIVSRIKSGCGVTGPWCRPDELLLLLLLHDDFPELQLEELGACPVGRSMAMNPTSWLCPPCSSLTDLLSPDFLLLLFPLLEVSLSDTGLSDTVRHVITFFLFLGEAARQQLVRFITSLKKKHAWNWLFTKSQDSGISLDHGMILIHKAWSC